MRIFRNQLRVCGLALFAAALVPASGSNLRAANSGATSEATWGATSGATPIDPEVLAAREAAWRAYFAGDVRALGALLPEEFIGIGMNEAPFAGRAKTLEDARVFLERGGKLVRLAFPETQAQRFGDVVVLYGRFEVVLQSGGTERTLHGRLTEVFVRRDGTWVHPGWHLDLTAAAPASSPSQ